MEVKLTINELASKVIEELEKLRYSYNSICGFRAFFKRFNTFAESHGEQFFSEELGSKFLEEQYGCTVNYYLESYPRGTKHAIRGIRLLGDYQLHGVIIRRIVKKPGYVKPPLEWSSKTGHAKLFFSPLIAVYLINTLSFSVTQGDVYINWRLTLGELS